MAEGPLPMDDREATDLRYELRSIARTPIRDVRADALVKVRGTVMLDGPAPLAPISGTPCALYYLEAQLVLPVWTSGDDDELARPHSRSTPLLRESGGRALLLDDGSGRAVVRIARARLSLLGTWKTEFAHIHAQFLAAHGVAMARKPAELEYRELTVVPGELLTVYGRAIHEADPGLPASGPHPYRAVFVRHVFVAAPSSPLYIVQERVTALDAVG